MNSLETCSKPMQCNALASCDLVSWCQPPQSTEQPQQTGHGFQEILLANSKWLHATPRSTGEILLTLFPGSVNRVKEIQETESAIGDLLLSDGYLPIYGDDLLGTKWLNRKPENHSMDKYSKRMAKHSARMLGNGRSRRC